MECVNATGCDCVLMYVNLNGGADQASNPGEYIKVTNVNTSNPRQRAIRTLGAVVLGVAVACAPMLSYAQGMGGGHASGGGHMSGGHVGGGHSSGRAASGHAVARGGYAGAHYAGGGYGARGGFQPTHTAFAGHTGFVGGHGYAGHGAWNGGSRYWGGGYWGGRYWPHSYFYPGYAWFLPLLPLGYATFWWGGLPYYYSNSLYYTWNPGYNGYVVTDPPPVAGGDSGDASADASQYSNADAPQYNGAAPMAGAGAQNGGSADVYVYPRNGQNEQQTSTDRYECHSWAVNQTGFDPTRAAQQSGTSADYRRAMIACLDARGYTAR